MRAAIFSFLAFLIGYQVVHGGEGHGPVAQELLQRQEKLMGDLRRLATARKELIEVMATRASGEFILSREEEKLERTSRVQLHIFMERYRNDTLETLAMYERVLGKRKKKDILETTFGKTLTDIVSVRKECPWYRGSVCVAARRAAKVRSYGLQPPTVSRMFAADGK